MPHVPRIGFAERFYYYMQHPKNSLPVHVNGIHEDDTHSSKYKLPYFERVSYHVYLDGNLDILAKCRLSTLYSSLKVIKLPNLVTFVICKF